MSSDMLMRLGCFNENVRLRNGKATATAGLNPVEVRGTRPSISTSRKFGGYNIYRTRSLITNILAKGDEVPVACRLYKRPE